MFDKLLEQICYVTAYFEDGSRMTVCTTLNQDILLECQGTNIPGTFYDLIKKRHVRFRHDAVDIQVYTDDPDLREVDKFANQFI